MSGPVRAAATRVRASDERDPVSLPLLYVGLALGAIALPVQARRDVIPRGCRGRAPCVGPRMTSSAILESMRVVLVEPLPGFMEGLDRRDEVWDGVRHVPPLPTMDHQRLASRVLEALAPLARAHGLEVLPWPNLLDPARGFEQYRVPDLVVVDPCHTTNRGVEGPAELVVELLSPHDESRDKLPFYASRGVQEVWLIDPIARTVEQYLLRGDTYFTTVPDRDGTLRSPLFDLELRTVEGPRLRVAWPDGAVEL